MKTGPMSRESRSYFEQVALEFTSLAVNNGYDSNRYPNRSSRSNCYHNKVKFRLRDSYNALRVAVFIVDESFRAVLPAWTLAQRIYDEMTCDRRYIITSGASPKRFADQETLCRREPLRLSVSR